MQVHLLVMNLFKWGSNDYYLYILLLFITYKANNLSIKKIFCVCFNYFIKNLKRITFLIDQNVFLNFILFCTFV